LRHHRILTAAAIAGACLAIAAPLAWSGWDTQGWLLAARYTARLSFLVILVAFVAVPWTRSSDPGPERSAILAFGAAHGIHLGALITYRAIAGTMPSASGLVIGGAGYALLAVMVVFIVRGKTSRAFQAGALHYLLVVFLLTYATKISTVDQHWAGLIGASICGAALMLRHLGKRVRRRGLHGAIRHQSLGS